MSCKQKMESYANFVKWIVWHVWFVVHKYTLSLAQLDLLVLFSQDLRQLWVALSNKV